MKRSSLVRFGLKLAALWFFLAAALHADLVTPPTFTSISVPATATLNDTVTVSASAEANYSDNSDGNDWNTPDHIRILAINIEYLAPGGEWTKIAGWCPTWVNPNSNSATLTLNTPGTWYVRFQAMDGRPWFAGWPTYAIAVSPPPGPVITSSLALGVNQGGYVNYYITATNSPTGYAASNLPPGLTLNTSDGHIYGNYTGASAVNTTISATNAYGTDTKTLSWSVTPYSISGSPAVSPSLQAVGQSVSLAYTAYANFGIAWVERTVWRPNGTPYSPGTATGTSGSVAWTPDGGPGIYTFTIRVVDSYYNYQDYAASFTVAAAPTAGISLSPASITFGQSSAVTMTLSQSSPGSLLYHWMLWDQGNGSYWTGIGFGWNFPSSTSGMTSISSLDGYTTGPNSSSKSFSYTPNHVGSADFLSWGQNNASAAPSNWSQTTLTISKATPSVSNWGNRSFPGTVTVQASDLNAGLSNPYSGGVSAPSGARTYSLNGAATTAGATVYPGTYTARVAYAGDANYNPVTADVTWSVTNRDPSISVQILNSAHGVIGLNGNGRAPVVLGQQFYIRVNGSDPDGNLRTLYSRLNNPSGGAVDYPQVSVSGGSASYDFGPYTANQVGVWDMWAHVEDGNQTGYTWQGQGWWGTTTPDIEVSPPPPVITSAGAMTATVGSAASYQTTASNSPTSFSYAWINSVGGASFNTATGLFQITANPGSQGTYAFSVSGTNASGTGAAQTVTLTVYGRQPGGSVTNTTAGGATTITFGQNLSLTWAGSAPDGNLNYLMTRIGGPAEIVTHTSTAPANASSFSDSGAWGTGYTWTTAGNASSMTQDITWRPIGAGSFATWGHVRNTDWSGAFNDGRDLNLTGPTFTVNKATPAVTFPSRTTAPQTGASYALTAADLNAALANPYSGAVAQPNAGAVTYRFAGTSTAVTVGTALSTGYTYTIEAVYPGDANYNATNPTATFAVAGASAPASVNVPSGGAGSTFVTVAWTASVSPAGINHYDIYRNGAYIGSSATPSYTDNTVAPSTAYTYTVKAVDNNGNVSVVSNQVSPTTAASFEIFTPL